MADTDYKGIDKLYHFLVCFIVACFSSNLAIGLALGKEYGDLKATGNHWCWWDITADILGVVLGTLVRWLVLGTFIWF